MLDNASHLLFGPVFDTVDIGLVVLDSQGCIVGWNEWMARVSRRPARDVLGNPGPGFSRIHTDHDFGRRTRTDVPAMSAAATTTNSALLSPTQVE